MESGALITFTEAAELGLNFEGKKEYRKKANLEIWEKRRFEEKRVFADECIYVVICVVICMQFSINYGLNACTSTEKYLKNA